MKFRLLFVILFCSLSASFCHAQSVTNAYVKVQGRGLVADFTGNGNYQPYIIRGVDYSPTPIGRYSSDWGYYVSPSNPNPNNLPNNLYSDPNILARDFTLLKQMNANTIRFWSGSDNLECGVSNVIFENAFPNQPTSYGDNIYAWLGQNGYVDVDGLVVANLSSSAVQSALQAEFLDAGEYATILTVLQNAKSSSTQCGRFPNMITTTTLATANNYGLHVIAGFFVPAIGATYKADSTDSNLNAPFDPTNTTMANDLLARFKNYVTSFKNRPEILFWAIGNENNLSLNPNNTAQVKAWYSLVNQMAGAAHQIEGASYHPVAVVNGDNGDNGPNEFIGDAAFGADDASLSNVDIWGINTYRGQSFGDFFVQYKGLSTKPLWVSEFGTDAFQSCNTTTSGCDPNNPSGTEDQADQATWDGGLWDQIAGNADITIGATVMEYSDEWWKPNDWICTNAPYIDETPYPSNSSAAANYCHETHLNFGIGPGSAWQNANAAAPDNYDNDEWWGLMAISNSQPQYGIDTMTPRAAYYTLQGKFLNAVNNTALPSYLVSPLIGSTLSSGSSTFVWSYGRGVSQYKLLISSFPGARDIYNGSATTSTSAAVTGIPLTGLPVYVQLGSYINGAWQYTNYTFQTLEQSFTITCTAGANGTITPASATVVDGGISPLFTVTPNAGFVVSSFTVNGVATAFLPSGVSFILVPVTENYNVVANFSPLPAPATPTNLSGIAVATSQINLSWTPSSGAAGYRVYRNGSQITSNTTPSFIDTGLTPATNYTYTVVAYNSAGSSAPTAAVTVQTPSATVSVDGSVLNEGTTGNLETAAGTWTFNSFMDIYGAKILLNGQSAANGYAKMLLVYNQGQMYAETTVSTWYHWTGSSFVLISGDPRPAAVPSVPTNLAGTAVSSSQINLTWNTSSLATGYKILRNGTQVGTSTSASYSDTGLSASTSYAYTVEASNSVGTSAPSTAVSVTTLAATTNSPDGSTLTPASTGNLVTSAGKWTFSSLLNSNGNRILLNNQSTGSYASLLLVYNSGKLYAETKISTWYQWNGSAFVSIGGDPRSSATISPDGSLLYPNSTGNLVTSAGTWTFSQTMFINGMNVILLNGQSIGSQSGVLLLVYNQGHMYTQIANGTWYQFTGSSWTALLSDPRVTITAPTNLAATVVSSSQINLTWNASTGTNGIQGYTIYRNGVQVGTSSTASYSDTGLTASTTYSYTVSAHDKNANSSAQSTAVTATTHSGSSSPSPDGTSLSSSSTSGDLITSAGTWTFSASISDDNGQEILLNGNSAAGGYGTLLLVYNSGHVYAQTRHNTWWLYTGSGWSATSDPRTSSTTTSPDGTTLAVGATGNLVTVAGTWTFSSVVGPNGNYILLNGARTAGNGNGKLLLVYNSGKMYAETTANTWWLYTGSGWSSVSKDPRTY